VMLVTWHLLGWNSMSQSLSHFCCCSRSTKSLCYLTLMRPLTEYSAVIWDPHTVENIRKLEMIQRRAARMVYADYQTTSSISTITDEVMLYIMCD
jgi:hypothetical protein